MSAQGPLPAAVRIASLTPDRARPVNRRLFGKFTEHLGRNVYGGAWAQLTANPAFAPAEVWPDREVLHRRLQAAADAFGLPGLAAPAPGTPPFWQADGALSLEPGAPLPHPGVAVVCPKGGAGSLRTPVHLPLHRVTHYRLLLDVRGDVPVIVSLHAAGVEAREQAAVTPTAAWTTHEVALPSPDGGTPAGESAVLELRPAGPGRLEFRRCLLFPADHRDGWDPDVLRFMRDAHLPLLRFPGGNFVSGYHWRDGIGPVAGRPVLPNPAWPEVEWNHVGTDEWLRLCELAGCSPMICVNAGNGTAEEAADWVQYCNGDAGTPMGRLRAANGHPAPYGVEHWEIGNEIYGAWQVGTTHAAGYAGRYRTFAEAMLARDPTIRLIANGDTEDWNRTVVQANPGRIRSLSHHCLYAGFDKDADPRRVYLEHMAFTPAYGQLWQELTRPLAEAGQAPRLAITEQQIFTHSARLPNNGTLTEAVWTASIINEALRAGDLVEMLTHSALVNHGGGLRKEREHVYAQPVWWTTHLYAAGTAAEPLFLIDLESEGPRFTASPYRLRTMADAPHLDAVAMTDEDREILLLFLINRHPDLALDLSLTLPTAAFTRAEIHTLTGASFMAANSVEEPATVQPSVERRAWSGNHESLLLPPCSLVRVRLA